MNKEDRNRLNISREGEQPPIYHYDREDRLSRPGAPRRDPKLGFFRRNRSLTIVLLDLFILLLIGLGIYFFLSGRSYQGNLGGYSLVLRGFPYKDIVFATLTVKRTAPPENSYTSGILSERIFVYFTLSGKGNKPAEGEGGYYLSAQLPGKRAEEIILREAIPSVEGADTLYAEIKIGEKTKRLNRELNQ